MLPYFLPPPRRMRWRELEELEWENSGVEIRTVKKYYDSINSSSSNTTSGTATTNL